MGTFSGEQLEKQCAELKKLTNKELIDKLKYQNSLMQDLLEESLQD